MIHHLFASNRNLFRNKMVSLDTIATYSNTVMEGMYPPEEKFETLIHQLIFKREFTLFQVDRGGDREKT